MGNHMFIHGKSTKAKSVALASKLTAAMALGTSFKESRVRGANFCCAKTY
jgi:hypothetical protein